MSDLQNYTGNEPESKSTGLGRKLVRGLVIGSTALVIAATTAGGIAALQYRASTEAQPLQHPPLAVTTLPVRMQEQYVTQTRYVGRLEPARQTSLAFELAGLVLTISVDEGSKVRTGDVIAQLDTDRLKADRKRLQARKRELEAERTLARLTLKRQSNLRKKGFSPQQSEDEATASVDRITASIDQVTAQMDLVDIDIRKSVLTAPFDGVVGTRNIDDGSVITAGTAVVSLLETGKPQARIGLPPDVARSLDRNARYRIETDAGPVSARLSSMRPDLQTATQTVPVLFDMVTSNGAAFQQIVTLNVETPVRERGTWLPLAALKEGHKGLWSVLVVAAQDGQAKVQTEAVEVLHIEGERAYVRGTLRANAQVVSKGGHRVVSGQLVALTGS
ncbi:efflux RND transporter periplasmic adaptor subunit [Anderseniella sp. Alg231-50]|uniref:efflux RND transporter periplasmic adaptor subunit n=1 Tax=Anderseniella sp. Alg231-50 TaxID=1922226 RepID=UPI000D561553